VLRKKSSGLAKRGGVEWGREGGVGEEFDHDGLTYGYVTARADPCATNRSESFNKKHTIYSQNISHESFH